MSAHCQTEAYTKKDAWHKTECVYGRNTHWGYRVTLLASWCSAGLQHALGKQLSISWLPGNTSTERWIWEQESLCPLLRGFTHACSLEAAAPPSSLCWPQGISPEAEMPLGVTEKNASVLVGEPWLSGLEGQTKRNTFKTLEPETGGLLVLTGVLSPSMFPVWWVADTGTALLFHVNFGSGDDWDH